MISMPDVSSGPTRAAGVGELRAFRREFYGCLSARADALFELSDAVLCSQGPVTSLPELSLAGVHRRGHGAMYDALACGQIDVARLRQALAGLVLPRGADGRLTVAIDVTGWPRPDAECAPERLHCYRHCRCDGMRQTIPGWPYSVAAALGAGRSSWTAPLDMVRLGPAEDATEATAAQIRDLCDRLITAGQLREGDPPMLVVLDSGYDLVRLSWLVQDLPVQLLGRIRADRVMYAPAGARRGTRPGRQPRHGRAFKFTDPDTWPAAEQDSTSTHERFGVVHAAAWARLHPKLERRGAWRPHPGPLPNVEATIIHVAVEHLPGNRAPKPFWLWFSRPDASVDLDLLWHTYLRRFDLEHTFRFCKQTLGLTRPRLRTPAQADRWVWLILTAYTQLRLVRGQAADLRRPWEAPLPPDKLTPARVRRGFPRIRRTAGIPASAPKATRPGPGRPPGSANKHRAPRHGVGKHQLSPETQRRAATKKTPKTTAPG